MRSKLLVAGAIMLAWGAYFVLPAIAGYDPSSDPEGKANGLDYRSSTAYFAGAGGAVAACPDGKRLTGGGAAFDGDSSNAELRLLGPDSISPSVSARVAFSALGSVEGLGQELTAFAICTKGGGIKRKNKQTTSTPLPGDLVSVKSRCPRGTAVLGGGVRSETVPELVMTSAPFDSNDADSAPDDGWTIRVVNGQGIFPIEAMSICSSTLEPRYVVKSTPSGTGELKVSAVCKQKEAVAGGGAELSGDEGAYLNSSRPADISDTDTTPSDGWLGVAYADSGSRTLTATAVCIP